MRWEATGRSEQGSDPFGWYVERVQEQCELNQEDLYKIGKRGQ